MYLTVMNFAGWQGLRVPEAEPQRGRRIGPPQLGLINRLERREEEERRQQQHLSQSQRRRQT